MTRQALFKIGLVVLLGLASGARPALAGPWVADRPGHGFVSLGYSNYSASEYFTGPGEQNFSFMNIDEGTKQHITVPKTTGFFRTGQNSDYVDNSMLFYGEVSLWKRLGFVAQMPLLRYITQQIEGGDKLSYMNVGDLTVGLKWQTPVIKKLPGLAFGPQIYFIAPTGNKNARAHYPNESEKPLPLPTGNGTGDVEFRFLSIGYSFYPVPIFMSADVGYHHHFNVAECEFTDDAGMPATQRVKYSDDLPWNFMIGGTWEPKYKGLYKGTLIASVRGVHSLRNGDVPGQDGVPARGNPFSSPCGQANNLSSVGLGGTLMWFPIKWVGLSYSVDHTLWGINTGYGLTNSISIVAEF